MNHAVNVAAALWIGLLVSGGPAAAAPGPAATSSPTAAPPAKGTTAAVEIRERWETRTNADFNASLPDDTSALLQRYRVTVTQPAGSAVLILQPQLVRSVAASAELDAEVHQGYVEWPVSPDGRIRLGRQELVFGDSRLLGNGDWSMQGRTWDAARLWWGKPAARLDVFGARLVKFQALPAAAVPHLFGAYATRSPSDHLTLDGYLLLKTQGGSGTGNGDIARWTAGGRAAWKEGRWDFGGQLAWQFGQDGTAGISAWALGWTVGYGIKAPWAPRVEAEYDYASGNSSPANTVNGTFDQLFSTNHRYYGIADYVGWRNMETWRLGTALAPWPGAALQVDYLSFQLAQARDAWYGDNGVAILRDSTGAAGTAVGDEWDAALRTKIGGQGTLDLGAAHFTPGPLVRAVRGRADASDWWYLQWTQRF